MLCRRRTKGFLEKAIHMVDPIRDELHRLAQEFNKLLGNQNIQVERTTPEDLMRYFGLTRQQAKTWLEREPQFTSSDDFLQREKNRRNRRGLDRTLLMSNWEIGIAQP